MSSRDIGTQEEIIAIEKLNQYLSEEAFKLPMVTGRDWSLAVYAINGCCSYKPQKINRQTFVNYFLPEEQQDLFGTIGNMSSISHPFQTTNGGQFAHKADNSADTIKQLFEQIRPAAPNQIFQKSFNPDPRVVDYQAKLIGNLIPGLGQGRGTVLLGDTIDPNQTSLTQAYMAKKPITSLVTMGASNNLRESGIDGFIPGKQVPTYDRNKIMQDHLEEMQRQHQTPNKVQAVPFSGGFSQQDLQKYNQQDIPMIRGRVADFGSPDRRQMLEQYLELGQKPAQNISLNSANPGYHAGGQTVNLLTTPYDPKAGGNGNPNDLSSMLKPNTLDYGTARPGTPDEVIHRPSRVRPGAIQPSSTQIGPGPMVPPSPNTDSPKLNGYQPYATTLGGRNTGGYSNTSQPTQPQPIKRELEILDENSFMNYKEIEMASSRTHRLDEDLRQKMDPAVLSNLKKYEFDF